MREKRTFAERTKVLQSDEVRKKYFLVFEGKDTERIYFEAVNEHRDKIRINPLIELVPVLRSYSEESWSNPKKILDRVLQNIAEARGEKITLETLLNWIMDYFYDEKILTTSKAAAANMWSTLELICREKLNVKLTDYVEDIEKVCTDITTCFSEKMNLKNIIEDVPKIIKNRSITYADGLDKICFIIDRDRNSFVSTPENDQYGYVVRTCREKGMGFYLSNPCFEFWLLLHFEEVRELDFEQLLNNPKVTAARRYAEHELRRLLPGYTKSKYPVDELLLRVDTAIRNESDFCEDENELEHSVGSRVGLLIKEMRMTN